MLQKLAFEVAGCIRVIENNKFGSEISIESRAFRGYVCLDISLPQAIHVSSMFPSTVYGRFTGDGQSYEIHDPFPPSLLTNPLYNDDGYVTLVSHYCSGDATLTGQSLTESIVAPGKKTLYCRDEGRGDVWTPGVYPMMSAVRDYRCEHHDTCSIVTSEWMGIVVTWAIWVPFSGAREIWTVSVQNCRREAARISLVPAAELLCTGFGAPRFFENQEQVGQARFIPEINGMFYFAANPHAPWKRKHVALVASRPVSDYCGDAQVFMGAPLSMAFPQRLLKQESLGNVAGCIGTPFVSMRCEIVLAPQESGRFDFVIAAVESVKEARHCYELLLNSSQLDADRAETAARRLAQRSRLLVRTPNPQIDSFVNLWVKKGLEYCLLRKNAPRDNLQFADGVIMARPDLARKEILRVLPYQNKDGWIVRSWFPMDATRYSDCHLWLIHAVCGYLKYSDDVGLLFELVAYSDGGEGTVLEHLERSIKCTLDDCGPHGLPRIRYADWNDAMNLKDPDAESVFCAMFLGYALKEMEALMKYLARETDADRYGFLHRVLKDTVNQVAWDEKGGYYVAAFADGTAIGGSESEGARVFSYPQSWAILGQIAPENRVPRILKTLDEHLETHLGTAVNLPPYDHWNERLGRISAQVPGTTENGAVYCHVTGFKAAADALLGRGDAALRSLLKIMPDSAANPAENSQATPYALTSSYILNPDAYGRAGRPWLTGTQDWYMRTVIEGLLGVQRSYGGFRIAPAFPSDWGEAQICIRREEDSYDFRIRTVSGCEGLSIRLDNEPIDGNFVPFQSPGNHAIQVLIGHAPKCYE